MLQKLIILLYCLAVFQDYNIRFLCDYFQEKKLGFTFFFLITKMEPWNKRRNTCNPKNAHSNCCLFCTFYLTRSYHLVIMIVIKYSVLFSLFTIGTPSLYWSTKRSVLVDHQSNNIRGGGGYWNYCYCNLKLQSSIIILY